MKLGASDRTPRHLRGARCDATKKITVYCNTGFRSAHAYLAMRLLGYPHVRNYVGSWQEWGNREGLPIASRTG